MRADSRNPHLTVPFKLWADKAGRAKLTIDSLSITGVPKSQMAVAMCEAAEDEPVHVAICKILSAQIDAIVGHQGTITVPAAMGKDGDGKKVVVDPAFVCNVKFSFDRHVGDGEWMSTLLGLPPHFSRQGYALMKNVFPKGDVQQFAGNLENFRRIVEERCKPFDLDELIKAGNEALNLRKRVLDTPAYRNAMENLDVETVRRLKAEANKLTVGPPCNGSRHPPLVTAKPNKPLCSEPLHLRGNGVKGTGLCLCAKVKAMGPEFYFAIVVRAFPFLCVHCDGLAQLFVKAVWDSGSHESALWLALGQLQELVDPSSAEMPNNRSAILQALDDSPADKDFFVRIVSTLSELGLAKANKATLSRRALMPTWMIEGGMAAAIHARFVTVVTRVRDVVVLAAKQRPLMCHMACVGAMYYLLHDTARLHAIVSRQRLYTQPQLLIDISAVTLFGGRVMNLIACEWHRRSNASAFSLAVAPQMELRRILEKGEHFPIGAYSVQEEESRHRTVYFVKQNRTNRKHGWSRQALNALEDMTLHPLPRKVYEDKRKPFAFPVWTKEDGKCGFCGLAVDTATLTAGQVVQEVEGLPPDILCSPCLACRLTAGTIVLRAERTKAAQMPTDRDALPPDQRGQQEGDSDGDRDSEDEEGMPPCVRELLRTARERAGAIEDEEGDESEEVAQAAQVASECAKEVDFAIAAGATLPDRPRACPRVARAAVAAVGRRGCMRGGLGRGGQVGRGGRGSGARTRGASRAPQAVRLGSGRIPSAR